MKSYLLTKLKNYNQYKYDIFSKLDFDFLPKRKILDLGCGDGSDSVIFEKVFNLNVYSCDIYENSHIKENKLNFKLAGIYKLPYEDDTFDYVFMHDVLHHIDESGQRLSKHKEGLKEVFRVLKTGGTLIIVEGNRYNPLFYPHMVKILGHAHFRQSYFKKLIQESFKDAVVEFKYFEAHLYPSRFLKIWKLYEYIMEKFSPKRFLSYNVALVKKS